MSFIKSNMPLIVALAAFVLSILVLGGVSFDQNQHAIGYALDDAYIQMAIAKNVAAHGVWGVTSEGFSSSSSSLLWTALLSACFWGVGNREILPLVINIVCAVALLWSISQLLRRHGVPRGVETVTLLGVVLLTPLPTLCFIGLEHTLHTLLAVWFVYAAGQVIGSEESDAGGWRRCLLVLAPLVATIRFEGLFMVFAACLLLLLRRRSRLALLVGVVAVLPVGVYGAISWAAGWYPVPNSVLLKAARPALSVRGAAEFVLGFTPHGATGLRSILEHPHVLVIVLLASTSVLGLYARNRTLWRPIGAMLLIVLSTTLLHMQFAKVGWFFRYEAYLLIVGMVAVALAGWELLRDREWPPLTLDVLPVHLVVLMLALLLSVPLIERAARALLSTPAAISNIYEQQYQMGTFLETYYRGEAVAANDIGAISYLADVRLLDIGGLASIEVVEAKRRGEFGRAGIEDLANDMGVRIAIIYDTALESYGGVPTSWRRAGSWTISGNVVCAGDTVTFYAIGDEELQPLRSRLYAFAQRLPEPVSWELD